ncbi:MAG: diaminopimelate decarboxylase [Gemmatimonadetes bacterium]|nr:diaminopimelate decarboxylase [Gemmatimonadota bacterium]
MVRPFPRLGGEIHCGSVPISELADRYGTPLYVYDLELVEERYKAFARAFDEVNPLVAYSVKANGGLAILHRLASLGSGADIVSLGELYRARRAGIPAGKIVFAGVAKTVEEMRAGIHEGIYAFNVEGRGELERLDAVATEMGARAPFAIRVNPDIHSPTPHEYTRTGHAESKFGVPVDEAYALYRWAQGRPHLKACGIDVHIGSQILDPMPYFRALSTVADMAADLRGMGAELRFVDIGGGFGVGYDDEPGMVIADLARALLPLLSSTGLRLVAEPGRFIVGEAGALVTRVQYVKRAGHKTFVIVDGGMTELIRPSHYGGYHAIEPAVESDDTGGADEVLVDVVGPICESGDFLARDRPLRIPAAGELLVVKTAGAYGFAMASNYNARRRPAEALVDRGDVYLVRRRESLEDLVRGEVIPWEGSPEGS